MGDVVNTTQRLEKLGGPGAVIVGPATYVATREVIRYEAHGQQELRGRDEPVEAYRAIAALGSAPAAQAVGYFARLPTRLPVVGQANRFGATTSAPWLLPPSRVVPFARALRAAGVGYVRDEIDWNVIEPARGHFLTSSIGRFAHAFRDAGIRTLGALWTLTGTSTLWAWNVASGY